MVWKCLVFVLDFLWKGVNLNDIYFLIGFFVFGFVFENNGGKEIIEVII